MPDTESMSFRIDRKLAEELRRFAKREELSLTDMIISCIKYRLKESSPAHAINKGFYRQRKLSETVYSELALVIEMFDLFIREYFKSHSLLQSEDEIRSVSSAATYERFFQQLKHNLFQSR